VITSETVETRKQVGHDSHCETWPNVVRLTSGVLTTHYMAIEETPDDNRLFIAHDLDRAKVHE